MSPLTAQELEYVFGYLELYGNRTNNLVKCENKQFCLLVNVLNKESTEILKNFGIIYNEEIGGMLRFSIHYNDDDRKKFMIWWKLTK